MITMNGDNLKWTKGQSLPLSFSLSIVLYGIAWAYYCTLQMPIYSHNPLAMFFLFTSLLHSLYGWCPIKRFVSGSSTGKGETMCGSLSILLNHYNHHNFSSTLFFSLFLVLFIFAVIMLTTLLQRHYSVRLACYSKTILQSCNSAGNLSLKEMRKKTLANINGSSACIVATYHNIRAMTLNLVNFNKWRANNGI